MTTSTRQDTPARRPPLPDRETITVVRGTKSEARTRICRLARRVLREVPTNDTPKPEPILEAAMLALSLEHAPYTSVAVRAHTLCVKAMLRDLRSIGQVDTATNALAAALSEALSWGAGLTLDGGTWKIDPAARRMQALMPFAADLAWDVDGMLETGKGST